MKTKEIHTNFPIKNTPKTNTTELVFYEINATNIANKKQTHTHKQTTPFITQHTKPTFNLHQLGNYLSK